MARRQNGWVKGPCPGCKTGQRHPKDSVCSDCKQLMATGAAAVKKAAGDAAAGTVQPFIWASTYWCIPYYYGPGVDCSRVQAVLFDLVAMVSDMQPEGTAKGEYKQPGDHRTFECWPAVIEGHKYHDWVRVVHMKPKDREVIQALDQVLRDTMAGAYAAGKRDGRNLLLGLASGEVSVGGFNEATEEGDTRGRR